LALALRLCVKRCGGWASAIKKTLLYAERDEISRLLWQETLRGIPKDALVYVDECGIDHGHRLTRGWGKRGARLYGEKPGNRTGRTSVIAALCGRTLQAPFCFEGYCNADVFTEYVRQCLAPTLTPGKIVVMDNARFHQASDVRTLIEERECSLKYLPTYSPDLNPIEHCWQHIKHAYAKYQHNFDDHANAIDFAVNQYTTTTLC
jgi:transposase